MVLRLSVAVSLVALLALAGLQYQWIGQIEVAERQRLERSVAESSEEFAEDFSNEVRGLAMILEPRPAFPSDPESIAMRYKEWAATATYPALLKNLYVSQPQSVVLRLDRAKGVFETAEWPPHLSRISEFVSWQGGPPLDFDADVDVILMPLDRRFAGGPMRGRGFRGPGGPPGGPGPGGPPGVPPEPPGPPRESPPPRNIEDERWIVAELNHEVLTTQVLPALVERRFPNYESQDYRVAVVARRPSDRGRVVFTSKEAWTDKDLADPDYQLPLLAPPTPRPGPPGERGGPRGPRGGGDRRGSFSTFAGQGWRLLVKHRAGSVELAAQQFKRRNLAISFGVLVVLGIGTVAMVISGSRARRLGHLQMEFAAGVSHELRTPLAVIQSAAHNLRAGVVQNREDIEEYAAIVQTEARRLTEMVEQVMTYTETQSGRRRYDVAPVNIGDVADSAIQNSLPMLQEGNATVEKHLDPDLPPVMADGPALTRCLQNLLSNAVKYGRSNYSAQIALEGRFVTAPGSSGKVELSVVDHGLGVPEADVNHLFEAFYRGSNATTNTPGNGLGLHLVQRIMEAQNGAVTYSRTDDGGARFTLVLPVAPPTCLMRRRILLVEDEPGLRRTLKDLLTSSGYAVETNADGADGQAHAEREAFDLIVLDVMLPSRSGFDVAKNLRKSGNQTPILMLTARTELNNKVQGFKAGADDYLTKPFEAPELLARVEALLRRSAAGARKKLKTFEFHGVHVDFTKAHLSKNGEIISLSDRECRLLQHLIESDGEVVTRDELLQEVWGYSGAPMTRTVDVHIAWLRQKVEEDPSNPRFIVTVHGQGYRFSV